MTIPSPEQVILTTAKAPAKIYFREQRGIFQRNRRILASILMLIFIVFPFIKYDANQAFLIDVAEQKIHFFNATFYPQDLMLVTFIFVLAAFILFYVSRIYGRVWCGFSCPQTIWMLLFNWVERRIEGSHSQSQLLDKQAMNLNKLAKKSVKHSIWLLISFLTATTFMSYFVPVETLYANLFNFADYALVQAWILFFALCTYINGGWIKEKMCLHICPYARFQSAIFDKHTKVVTYDASRGEQRGPRKRKHNKPDGLGDCVDCKLCVDVCPVGIDIRKGLQYECISCGLCIDACDSVMSKFNYSKGLIKFNWQQAPKRAGLRHLGYGSVTFITLLMMGLWFAERTEFETNVLRDRNKLYREDFNGFIENTYTIKTLNKSQDTKVFSLRLVDTDHFSFVKIKNFEVSPGEYYTQVVSVKSKTRQLLTPIEFKLQDLNSSEVQSIQTSFYGPGE
ncbi:cytochrome c oxidase accessory protein CcoG [Gayadomonas joobiniege]|uniref:cytochrome c oxidase accessory protein CcoG n=1 Tax=Gayadomonas joobiniege TaxID=1234606 RepID=UPI0003798E6F|nr:cytochrome c oxidase accessory protein CcoG [Gayadomonas joobiniege]